MILVALRFYMKSIFGILEVQNPPFAILQAVSFVNLIQFSLQKVQKFRASEFAKMAYFGLLESQKMISRKI